MTAKFSRGQLAMTSTAAAKLHREDVIKALMRHATGDWGEVSAEDWKRNDQALIDGYKLHSVYTDRHGVKFWIMTRADRSGTAILLPEDYQLQ